MTAFQVGYFTVSEQGGGGGVDWNWPAAQPAVAERGVVRHVRVDAPVRVRMDGRRREGIIAKPVKA